VADERHQLPFRLSSDHMRNLDKAAKICGQTRQAFVQAAVLGEISEVLEQARLKKIRIHTRPNSILSSTTEEETDTPLPSSGISFLEAIQGKKETKNTPAETASPNLPGQVVVNVGNSAASSGGDLIERLAAFVTSGHDFEQHQNLRVATNIIQRTTPDEAERKVLDAKLNEAIATKMKAKNLSGEGILHTAKVTFDKLSDLLRR